MKILHFIPSIDRAAGGTTTYMQLLANELGKLVDLYIVTGSSLNPVEIENTSIKYIPTGWKQYYKMQKAWKLALNDIQPDIIHVNCCWMPECAWAQRWAQQEGYRVVLSPHGMLEPWIIARHYWSKKLPALLLYQKKAIKKAVYLHATAESEKENLLKLGYNKKIAVVANGIDIGQITSKTDWTRKRKLLFLSRVHVKKGIEILIDAVSQLKEQFYGYTVSIAGEGEEIYVAQLQQRIEKKGVSSLFHFCKGIYGTQKWELFKEADVFILPTYSENFGIVIAEALASGTPVITTKGTPWQELNTYHCGWWIDNNTQELVKVLQEFLELSDSELKERGCQGRKLVEEKYSSVKMAQDMLQLYCKILNDYR